MVLSSGTIKSLGITALFLKNLWFSQWLPERKRERERERDLGYFGHYEETSESNGKKIGEKLFS